MEECQRLGEYLREQRQRMGLSLADISSLTKVTLHYLQAIEDGLYDQLPAETYLKGFLVSYAEILGLSPDKTLERYQQECPAKETDLLTAPSAVLSIRPAADNSRKNTFIAGLLLFLTLSGAAIWWIAAKEEPEAAVMEPAVVSFAEQDVEQSAPTTLPINEDKSSLETKTAVNEQKQPAEEPPSPEPVPTSPEKSVAAVVSQDPPADEVREGYCLPAVMELRAIRSVAVMVRIDGRPTQSYALQPESLLRWRVREAVDLQIDPPGAAVVSLADTEVAIDGFGHFAFTPVEN